MPISLDAVSPAERSSDVGEPPVVTEGTTRGVSGGHPDASTPYLTEV
jgi:hypothetical protein